jgi:3-oxoacyl-[acyl-carrier-protein] synthase-3
VRDPSPKAGFSFDLMNGACGPLNAVQIAGAFLAAGSAEFVLVVTGDAHPSTAGTPHPAGADFPYATLGAAMLLERTWDPTAGFGRLHTATADSGSPGLEGYIDLATMANLGRHQITVERDSDYAERLLELITASIRDHAAAEGIDLHRTLLATAQPTPGFAADVARRLGLDERAVVTVSGVDGDPHSSAVILAYHQAVQSGLVADYDQVLFAAAGAGLSAACAVYRPRTELSVR